MVLTGAGDPDGGLYREKVHEALPESDIRSTDQPHDLLLNGNFYKYLIVCCRGFCLNAVRN